MGKACGFCTIWNGGREHVLLLVFSAGVWDMGFASEREDVAGRDFVVCTALCNFKGMRSFERCTRRMRGRIFFFRTCGMGELRIISMIISLYSKHLPTRALRLCQHSPSLVFVSEQLSAWRYLHQIEIVSKVHIRMLGRYQIYIAIDVVTLTDTT